MTRELRKECTTEDLMTIYLALLALIALGGILITLIADILTQNGKPFAEVALSLLLAHVLWPAAILSLIFLVSYFPGIMKDLARAILDFYTREVEE